MTQSIPQPVYWLNSRLVPAAEAVVPVTDHGLLYGDGVFEGIRFYYRCPFRLDAHLDRLVASARALMLELPMDRDALVAAVTEVIGACNAANGYIRLVVTRGSGNLGLDPSQCERPNLFMIADRMSMVPQAQQSGGIELVTASTRRSGPAVLDPRIKSLNYLNNILAKLEAHRAGADEALLLNAQGHVAEGTAENLFMVSDGKVFTPPVSDGALDGITRGVVLELCAELGIEAQERSLTPYDLYTAESCFLCGTGAELIPVQAVDGRILRYVPGPYFERIAEGFRKLIERECQNFFKDI